MKKLELGGQGSIEFLLMLALFLTILAAFSIPSMMNPARSSSEKIREISDARVACDQIASAINNITYQENAKDTIGVSISTQWTLTMVDSNTPMVKVQVDEKGVEVKNEVDSGFDDSVTLSSGSYRIVVKKGDQREIIKSGNKIWIILNPG